MAESVQGSAALDATKPHAFEWDHFRFVAKYGVQFGVCRCGKDYASSVHFGGSEDRNADY